MKSIINVVGALIKDNHNRILICQRPESKKRGLLWEFVGGKVENNESFEEALIRECNEELNIIIKPEKLFSQTTYSYPDITVNLNIFNASILSGTPELKEHNDLKWIDISEIDNFEFCPADIDTINKIKISSY